jgi:hypothetical protein
MRQPEVPTELVEVIKSLAAERHLGVAHDTHYDAFNWELQWWTGRELHRLDFQPWPDDRVLVFHTVETYPAFAKLLRWAWRSIPLFPNVAKAKSTPRGELAPGVPKEQYAMRIRELLADAA